MVPANRRLEVMRGSRGWLRSPRAWVAVLVAGAVVLSGLIARDMFFPPTASNAASRTYTVQQGTVRIQVSGTGNVVPSTQVGVAPKTAGTLSEVDVHVGDHVLAGQLLAKIDTTTLQTALDQASANLQTAQANLQTAQTPLTADQVTQLQHAVENAQTSYNDAVTSASATNAADAAAVSADNAALAAANLAFANDQAALAANVQYQTDKRQLVFDQGQLTIAQAQFNTDGCATAPLPFTGTCLTDFNAVKAAQATVNADAARLPLDQAAAAPTNATDQAAASTASAKLTADQAKQSADGVAGQKAINAASSQLTSARDQLNVQSTSKPNQVASAQAAVATAQAAVSAAQNNLDGATLRAPANGVISAINGQVGEAIGATTGITSEAPGTSAPQPSSSSTGSSSGSGASSAFMVLSSDSAYEVIAPFAETDAAKLAANQTASMTFDALTGLNVPAHLLALAATASTISSVVNYYATFTLDRIDARLKSGMTANATVTVQQQTGVTVVSNQALHRAGGLTTVTLLKSDGSQQTVPVQTGLVGDTTTEVVSGLSPGEKVVLPALSGASSGTTRGIRGTGGGGGGIIAGGPGG